MRQFIERRPCQRRYSQSADVWSFGIVLLELAKGKAPLSHCSFTKIIIDTVHGPAPSLEAGSSDRKFSKVAQRPYISYWYSCPSWCPTSAVEVRQHEQVC